MPTGYTSFIENGQAKTPKDFLQVCLRQFGVMIDYRDDPLSIALPEKLKEDTFAKKRLKEVTEELTKALAKDNSYWEQEREKKLKDAERDQKREDNEYNTLLSKYTSFKNAIEKWNCNPKFNSIKEFALDQLNISWPKKSDFYQRLYDSIASQSTEEFRNERIGLIKKDIDYYTKSVEEENNRNKERAEFFSDFKADIEKLV